MLVPFYLAPPAVSAPVFTLTPDDIAAITASVLAALMGSPIPVNVQKVNDVPIRGSGTPGDTWGPA